MTQVTFRSHNEAGEEIHEYRLDGRVIPSVSEILSGTGISSYEGVPERHLKNAKERGITVDAACQLYDEDNPVKLGNVMLWQEDRLDSFLDPETLSYLMGWIKFRTDYGFKPHLIARPMSHTIAGMAYGMTPDRVGVSEAMGSKLLVVDIKATAEVMLSHKVQLAGYKQPFKPVTSGEQPECHIVQLKPGAYHLPGPFNDLKYERAFIQALSLTHFKRQEK